ncbi:MAG: hypothetical protein LQ349_000829 [Xanthoria aureola]|nr:MAG: hypothetical protein LQ349_000829 [Xanthoria aureola]
MADKPPAPVESAAKDVRPTPQPKPTGNPVFRMMGMPNFRFKLPSRNWLIFLSITGSFTTAILYDRYHRKRAQQRWCNLVSHIAHESLPPSQMPRRITIFLSAPPGDSIRAAREHFHEYVKPVLAAAAMDWDVIEGRREGDVRAGLAEKIRKRRRKDGEAPVTGEETKPLEETEDLVQQWRVKAGVKDLEGVQGDLILGRHTWKEYVRGLHEGWLGPLDPPPDTAELSTPGDDASPLTEEQQLSAGDDGSPISETLQTSESPTATAESAKPANEPAQAEAKKVEKPKTPVQIPPYISTSAYSSAPLAPTTPMVLPPTTILPLPHLLGFLNTPIRIYRFLNRRHLADETGREVAALVLAGYIRPWDSRSEGTGDLPFPGDQSSTGDQRSEARASQERWEPEGVLEGEERDWHKVAWKRYQGEPERVWRNSIVIEPRIRERMRRFDLPEADEDQARKDEGRDPAAKGLWARVKETMGWEEDGAVKGWEHGSVGEESE